MRMGRVEIPCSPGDYIMQNRIDAPIAKITNIYIGIRTGIVIRTSGKPYYPIKIDDTNCLASYREYREASAPDRYFIDYIAGDKDDLKGIQATMRYEQKVRSMCEEIMQKQKEASE